MDKAQWKRFGEAARTFLLRKWSGEVLVFLFFVVLSAVFWFVQTLDSSYDMKVQIPLQVTDIPPEVVITTDSPKLLKVTLHDKGYNLIRYYFTLRGRELAINFAHYDKGRSYGRVVVPAADLHSQITPWIDGTTTIGSIHPDTIDFYFTRGIRKRVPVRLAGVVDADNHHFLAEYHFEPDSVTVWGGHDILDTLTAVYTDPVQWPDLHETTTQQVALTDIWDMKTEPDYVSLTATVDTYVEKSISVSVAGINFPAGKTLKTFPAEISIHFHIGAQSYHSMVPDSFVVGVTYQELQQLPAGSGTFEPKLRYAPQAAKNVRLSPASVEFLIEDIEVDE